MAASPPLSPRESTVAWAFVYADAPTGPIPLYPVVPHLLPRPEHLGHVHTRLFDADDVGTWTARLNGRATLDLHCPRGALVAALDAAAPALAPWSEDTDRAPPPGIDADVESFYTGVRRRAPHPHELERLRAYVRAVPAAPDGVYDVSDALELARVDDTPCWDPWGARLVAADLTDYYDSFGPLPPAFARDACPSCGLPRSAAVRNTAALADVCPGLLEVRTTRDGRRVAFFRPCGHTTPVGALGAAELLDEWNQGGNTAAPVEGVRSQLTDVAYSPTAYFYARWTGSTSDVPAPRARNAVPLGIRRLGGRRMRGSEDFARWRAFLVYAVARYHPGPVTADIVRRYAQILRTWDRHPASTAVTTIAKRFYTDIAADVAAALGRAAPTPPMPAPVLNVYGRLSLALARIRRRGGVRGGGPHASVKLSFVLAWLGAVPWDIFERLPIEMPEYRKKDRPCETSRDRVERSLADAARELLGPGARDCDIPVAEPFPYCAWLAHSPRPGARIVDDGLQRADAVAVAPSRRSRQKSGL